MTAIIAYYRYNIKVLLQDKLPLIWSIAVPLIFLYFNRETIFCALDLRFWWSYIIITSYVYGVGIYTMTMKESGNLKTLFSISYHPYVFFAGNLLTQITYCIICVGAFDIGAIWYFDLPILTVFGYSLMTIFLLIPVAFLGMLLTVFEKVHVNSISTFTNILMMIFFFSMNMDGPIEKINPLIYFANIIVIRSLKDVILYIIISGIFVICGAAAIGHFSVIPIERR